MLISLESIKSLTKRVTLLKNDVSVIDLRGHLETKYRLFSLRRDLFFFLGMIFFSNVIQFFPAAMVAKSFRSMFRSRYAMGIVSAANNKSL